jgi:hypothetical protein
MIFALIGVSAPTFWLGLIFLYVFFYKLAWAPPSGFEVGASTWDSVMQGKFILAWITLAITSAAFYVRIVRGNMLEVLSEDYIRTARAKGRALKREPDRVPARGGAVPRVHRDPHGAPLAWEHRECVRQRAQKVREHARHAPQHVIVVIWVHGQLRGDQRHLAQRDIVRDGGVHAQGHALGVRPCAAIGDLEGIHLV